MRDATSQFITMSKSVNLSFHKVYVRSMEYKKTLFINGYHSIHSLSSTPCMQAVATTSLSKCNEKFSKLGCLNGKSSHANEINNIRIYHAFKVLKKFSSIFLRRTAIIVICCVLQLLNYNIYVVKIFTISTYIVEMCLIGNRLSISY